ncbi:MAG: DNA-3-methyladenine glycosylase [Candidatus Bathyarchaeota archaeon]|nr:DNA-3-methyladenine glycosylase [Candidatus Bathyarchaeota archaeon]
MAFTETFTMTPLAPLDFDLCCQVFSNGNPNVRAYSNGMFNQVLRLGGGLVLAEVASRGGVEQPKLEIRLKSNLPITSETKRSAQEALTYVFNLNFDLKAFYKEAENDPTMNRIAQQLRGFRFPTTQTAFEGLVDAIVEQQISIKVARTIEERLATKFGDQLQIDDETYYAFPNVQNIYAASISDIRGCGLSERKAQYIYNAAHLIADGKLDLEDMKNNPDADAVIAELDELKGIGVWTAELTLLRGMQRWDVLPADDFGIRRVISTYYCDSRDIKAAEAREIAKNWGKWRGLAAFYLILAEVKGVVV